jgi:hypothetical protein
VRCGFTPCCGCCLVCPAAAAGRGLGSGRACALGLSGPAHLQMHMTHRHKQAVSAHSPCYACRRHRLADNGSIRLYRKGCSLPHCMHCTPWSTSQLNAKPSATAAACSCHLLCQVRFPKPSTALLTCCRCCLQVMQAPAQLRLHQYWPALGPAPLVQRSPHPF